MSEGGRGRFVLVGEKTTVKICTPAVDELTPVIAGEAAVAIVVVEVVEGATVGCVGFFVVV